MKRAIPPRRDKRKLLYRRVSSNTSKILKYNEMNKNTSISLGNYFDTFVQKSISKGRYKNVSEVIRAGLRLLEEEESKVIALNNAIQEGTDSGIAYDFDPKKHLESLKAKKRLNG